MMFDRIPVSLEALRQQAKDELDAMVEQHCRQGEDPWDFMPELPSVDEQVVRSLRTETILRHQWGESRSRAYHPAAPPRAATEFEYRILRQIALDCPQLTPTVWRMLGRINAAA